MGTTPVARRSSSRVSSFFSNLASCWDSAEGVKLSRRAASAIDPACATSTSIRSRAASSHAVRCALVSDEQLIAARDRLWEEFQIAAAPAAAPLAAWLAGLVTGRLPCLVVCGANADWSAVWSAPSAPG